MSMAFTLQKILCLASHALNLARGWGRSSARFSLAWAYRRVKGSENLLYTRHASWPYKKDSDKGENSRIALGDLLLLY
ncbi:hypothetical protein BJX62DRAFT_169745 [Aspergillus germanicus]